MPGDWMDHAEFLPPPWVGAHAIEDGTGNRLVLTVADWAGGDNWFSVDITEEDGLCHGVTHVRCVDIDHGPTFREARYRYAVARGIWPMSGITTPTQLAAACRAFIDSGGFWDNLPEDI